MKPLFKSAQQKVKKFIPSFRSHSPASSDHQLGRQADRSSTPTHTLHAPTSDNSLNPTTLVGTQAGTPDIKDDKKPVPTIATPTTLVGTQAGTPDIKDDMKPVPTITVEESPTPLAPISTPSKKFVEVKTTNAQHDLVVLHVAYILRKSPNLRSLILEIVRLSEKHDVRASFRCSFV